MAAAYLLDTNILIAAMRGMPPALLNRLAGIAPERLHLSSVVLAEIATGAEKSTRREPSLAAVQDITQGMPVLGFDTGCAFTYARLRAELERKGTPIGAMDLLIAAQAVEHGLVLVTDNLREFRRVAGLQCENWLR